MSPELVDQAILAQCRPQFYKVARVIVMVAKDLDVPVPIEGLFVDDLLTRKELKGDGRAVHRRPDQSTRENQKT
jgi:hypothetical protein